ncbi:hypothetical protein [Marivita cryptomonadis]|uniref:hypothetical protein n=1 Tax=Marivita cryptomonadis TaxID=505252 RepID=UPI000A1E7A73|nr:hypothetical protein [Marivita cryptomonadis]MBM2330512.1 hypothetical protein [Marivita cryptomonadis]MBM2344760.1 hypothetical protein [Marivita cryptomonadis]MBM2349438.1 hypothetical protein [Marivita cryptomonadis]MBM2368621.1 hypothetical protein [Marivita cryptomonadis]MBM2373291.1 hypothetical protein [Marivita cryptomonadis]
MNWFHLLRMAHWVRNPPSPARVKFVLAVIALCLAIVAIERWVGWPDWMSLEPEQVPNRVLR